MQERSSRALNWTSGFQLYSYSILYSYIKLTLHPYPLSLLLPPAISLLSQKSCSKQLEFWVLESYSPTQLRMKKFVKSKVAAQKWLWLSDNGKVFNNNNSGELGADSQLEEATEISLNCCY